MKKRLHTLILYEDQRYAEVLIDGCLKEFGCNSVSAFQPGGNFLSKKQPNEDVAFSGKLTMSSDCFFVISPFHLLKNTEIAVITELLNYGAQVTDPAIRGILDVGRVSLLATEKCMLGLMEDLDRFSLFQNKTREALNTIFLYMYVIYNDTVFCIFHNNGGVKHTV